MTAPKMMGARNTALDMVEQQARNMLRLMGPRMSAADCLQDELKLSRCALCDPPEPKVYTCPVCDWWTTDKWRMQIHNAATPEWCEARGVKKQKVWSAKVGLDG